MFSRLLCLAIGSAGLLVLGCTDPQSSPSTASGTPGDTAAPPDTSWRAAPWVEARRRSVRLRAIGQEPGWLVEVTAESLRVAWNYAQQAADGPLVDSADSAAGDTVRYRAQTAAGPVAVEAVRRRCVDPMSGDEFPWNVTVRFAPDTLIGCGRMLR